MVLSFELDRAWVSSRRHARPQVLTSNRLPCRYTDGHNCSEPDDSWLFPGNPPPFQPKWREFPSHEALKSFVKSERGSSTRKQVEGLSALMFPNTCDNVGHCMFDSLYPLYLAMHQMGVLGERGGAGFQVVEQPPTGGWKKDNVVGRLRSVPRTKTIIEAFSGEAILELDSLPKSSWVQLQRLVVGSGHRGC